MNKCDNCVKNIDICNVCTYNLEKTYKRQSSNIGDYGVMSDEEYWEYQDEDYDGY